MQRFTMMKLAMVGVMGIGAIGLPALAFAQAAPAAPDPLEQRVLAEQARQKALADAQVARADAQAAQADAQAAQADAQEARGNLLRAIEIARVDGNNKVGYWVNRGGKKEMAAFLGVSAVSADAALRDQLKVPRGIGLIIQTVSEDSPAAKAGLQEHDLITKIDDQWLVSPQQLGILVRMHKADEEITLSGLRQGQPFSVKAKLAQKEMVINDADGQQLFPENAGVNWAIPNVGDIAQWRGTLLDGDDAALLIQENDQTLKISMKGDERHLVATDNNGQVLFDGPVETDDQRKALPADLAEKLEKYKEQFDGVKNTPPGQRKVQIIRDR